MKPPSDKDIKGKRRTHKAFDLPRRVFDYLVVLDFEWTADNKKGIVAFVLKGVLGDMAGQVLQQNDSDFANWLSPSLSLEWAFS